MLSAVPILVRAVAEAVVGLYFCQSFWRYGWNIKWFGCWNSDNDATELHCQASDAQDSSEHKERKVF